MPVGGPGFTWGIVLPMFTPPAGTYASVQSVAITTHAGRRDPLHDDRGRTHREGSGPYLFVPTFSRSSRLASIASRVRQTGRSRLSANKRS